MNDVSCVALSGGVGGAKPAATVCPQHGTGGAGVTTFTSSISLTDDASVGTYAGCRGRAVAAAAAAAVGVSAGGAANGSRSGVVPLDMSNARGAGPGVAGACVCA